MGNNGRSKRASVSPDGNHWVGLSILKKAAQVPVQILNGCSVTRSIHAIILSMAISTQRLPNHYACALFRMGCNHASAVAYPGGKSGHDLPIQFGYRLWPPSKEEINVRYWEKY